MNCLLIIHKFLIICMEYTNYIDKGSKVVKALPILANDIVLQAEHANQLVVG